MYIVNRGYLVLNYKQPYFDWSNPFSEVAFQIGDLEPSVYLVEDDFMEEDKIIEKSFKKIMAIELSSVQEDEEMWVEITRENFDLFFDCVVGSSVFDTLKTPIQREEI